MYISKVLKIIFIFTVVFALMFYFTWEISRSRTYQVFGNMVNNIETEEKFVALTFDDGPTPENTENVLKILEELEVKATFFLTGRELEENPAEGKKIAEAGHEIGNHSFSHNRMVFKSPSFIKKELEETDRLIRETGFDGEIHFRPPYGKKLMLLPYYLKQQNKKTIMWDIEPETYPEVAADSGKIVNHVVENVKPGSIILLHVMYDSRDESVEAITGIVNSLRERGYTFKTVSDLIED